MGRKEEIIRLEKQGWIFKEIEIFRGRLTITWWDFTREIDHLPTRRDKEGFYDLIKVDGKTYKVYKNKILQA